MKHTISATEARVHFGELMQRIINSQNPVIVEKGGKAQVVIMSVAHYQRLQQEKAQDWLEHLEQTHALIEQELNEEDLPDPAEVIRKMREERDDQLLDMS